MGLINSPLRYPGGKSSLPRYLTQTIEINNLEGCVYVEPYAGGAGAAINLLLDNVVSKIVLNDVDPAVVAFWSAMLGEPERFLKSIAEVPLTVDEWMRQRAIVAHPMEYDPFERGFATFYLNRVNSSGILNPSLPFSVTKLAKITFFRGPI